MCFAVPSDDGGPPLVLDMNANQFGSAAQAEAAIAAGFGKSVFGSLGMRFVSTLLGGLLAGAAPDPEPDHVYAAATRGFFLLSSTRPWWAMRRPSAPTCAVSSTRA